MLPEKEDFVLNVVSDMSPGDVFETVSAPIAKTRVLHLSSLQVTCDPMQAEDGEPTRVKVEILWRDTIDEEAVNHPVDMLYTECTFVKAYSDVNACLDGTPMVGDGHRHLVIRRQCEGRVGPQTSMVTMRGHLH